MKTEFATPRRAAHGRSPFGADPLQSWQSAPCSAPGTAAVDPAPLLTRLAEPRDEALLATWAAGAGLAAAGGHESPLAHPPRADFMSRHIASGRVILAERGTRVLGFSSIQARPDGDEDIALLFVELDRWRLAVASLLVAHCADRARVLGARALHVVGAPRAARFHQFCGFELTGLEMTAHGVAQILRMRLPGH